MTPRLITSSDLHGNKYQVSLDELRWRPSAYAIVVRRDRILLAKQMDTLNLPGGGVEIGEMPEEAVVRETKEETGFSITNPRLVECQSGFFTFPNSKKDKKHAQTILLYYLCDFIGGEPSADGFENEEKMFGVGMPQWVELEKLHTIRAGGTMNWLDVVRKSIGLG